VCKRMLHTNKSDHHYHWDAKECPKPAKGVAQDPALAGGVQDAYCMLSGLVEPSRHGSGGTRPRQASGSGVVASDGRLPDSIKKWNYELETSGHVMVLRFCAVWDELVKDGLIYTRAFRY